MPKDNEGVLDLSKKCSATASELLSELKKLQLDPGDGLRRAIGKSLRGMRRKTFLEQTKGKLENYQKILNTRILTKLDASTVQQNDKFAALDQGVRDLALALDEGRIKVEQLLDSQTVTIQQHIDRRFDEQALGEAEKRVQKQFKTSLFFPEIYARQDDIASSHEATCHWILDPPRDTSNVDEADEDPSGTRGSKAPAWSSFVEWLDQGEEIYWCVLECFLSAYTILAGCCTLHIGV